MTNRKMSGSGRDALTLVPSPDDSHLLVPAEMSDLRNMDMVFVFGDLLFHVYQIRLTQAVKDRQWKGRSLKLKVHEFIQMVSGGGRVIADDTPLDVKEGEIVYIPKGATRRLISPKGVTAKIFVLRFDVSVNDHHTVDLAQFDYASELVLFTHFRQQPKARHYKLGKAEKIELERCVYSLSDEISHRKRGYQIVMQGTLLNYIGLLVRHLLERAAKLTARDRKNAFHMIAAEKAKDFVQKHSEQPLTVEQIAEECCVSPHYLCTLFKKETGYTLNQYLQYVRIENARRLMEEGGMSLTEIAHQVGYYDSSHFTRNFQKFTGVLPSEVIR